MQNRARLLFIRLAFFVFPVPVCPLGYRTVLGAQNWPTRCQDRSVLTPLSSPRVTTGVAWVVNCFLPHAG